MLGSLLIVILILALLGVLPRWSHSRSWGYGPSWGGTGAFHRCHSAGSRADLSYAPPDNLVRRHRLGVGACILSVASGAAVAEISRSHDLGRDINQTM